MGVRQIICINSFLNFYFVHYILKMNAPAIVGENVVEKYCEEEMQVFNRHNNFSPLTLL